jgi:hypothetical protein
MNQDPLLEWNRLNRENAEHEIVSVMFSNIVGFAPQVDTFSTWLIAGTGAAATLMITNIQSMITAFGRHGFKVALIMLVVSALFGLLAKSTFVFFQFGGDSQSKLIEQLKPIFEKHGTDEKGIKESAALRGIKLETDIRMDVVLSEFAKPLPWLVRICVLAYLNKHKDNRQVGHLLPLRAFHWQFGFGAAQSIAFILFVLSAVYYARAI